MHSEFYIIPPETAEIINDTRKKRRDGWSVWGTTSCRPLESSADEDGTRGLGTGWTDIFIYPGYRLRFWTVCSPIFHLPESTLIMLVSALAGRERILAAYQEAFRRDTASFPFGDAMFIYGMR
jgi:S-adenosylmethionine:tRNA ribosyltransferase-isomerase